MNRSGRWVWLLFITVLFSGGCASKHFGPPSLREGRASVPLDLTREKAIEKYGIPDQIHLVEGRAYWIYNQLDGTYISLLNYLSFGSVHRRAIQLEYEGDRLIRVEEYPAGSTFGFGLLAGAPPGMVSE